MSDISRLATYVSRVDQRLVVERQIKGRNLASVEAFPADPSEFLKGQIYQIDEEHELRHQPGAYAPDGFWPTVGFRVAGKLSWSIRGRHWLVRTSNLDEQVSDPVLQMRRRNIAHAHKKVRIAREIAAWNVLRDNTVITQGVSLGAGSRFDDLSSSSSDPIAVMRTGAQMIKKNTGLQCNCIMMSDYVLQKLGIHERIQHYAVNQLGLSKDRLTTNVGQIGASILELMIGADPTNPENGLIAPGSIKVTDFIYSPRADAPRTNGTAPLRAYASGPDVVMLAKATPGGNDGSDNGFGLLKYLSGFGEAKGSGIDESGINFDFPKAGPGNDGILVLDLPDYEVAGGGTKTQVLDYSSYFVQQASAAYLIAGALNASDTASYETSLQY